MLPDEDAEKLDGQMPLPKKTCFVFTEEHALRKLISRMLRDCPTLTKNTDREEFLVKFLQLMDEVAVDG